jgi:hypothetical protein
MKIISLLIATSYFSLIAFSVPSYAGNSGGVQFKPPSIKGSGCSGTSNYRLTPNKKTLSISFKKFITSSSDKTCTITVPITVPSNFKISVLTADYRGFVKGEGELKRNYRAAGSSKARKNRFKKTSGDDYYVSDNLLGMNKKMSQCGKNMTLKVSTRIKAAGSGSKISVDSDDSSSGAIFHLQYKPC